MTATISNKFNYYLGKSEIDFSTHTFLVLLMLDGFEYDPTTMFLYADIEEASWSASGACSLGVVKIPTTPNGHKYECTTAGTSDTSEPTWPTTSGGTVTDGTVTWTEIGADDQAPTANGYTQNNKALVLASYTFDDSTGKLTVTWDDPAWTASGGYLGSADGSAALLAGALIVDWTEVNGVYGRIVGYIEFATPGYTADGKGMKIEDPTVEIGTAS